MLKAASIGTTKTRLMVKTGLNYLNFIGYLSELLEEELIEQTLTSNQKLIYKTTKRGKEVLKALQEAQRRIEL